MTNSQNDEQTAISFIESTLGESFVINDNLQRTLRSGVILCRIIQKVKPELMPRISARPLPFLQMENIHNFLNAAKELGVRPDNLFQTSELYEGTDMNKVIHTLISLDKVLKGEKDDEIYISSNSLNSGTNKLPKKKNSSNSKHVSTIEIYEQSQRTNCSRVSPVEDNEVEQYQLGNGIGRGQFGCVYRALNLVTGQIVAIKRIKLEDQNKEDIDSLMQEVELLQSLSHPCIVSYYGFILNEEYLNIILEYVENGSLLNTLKSFGNFPEKLIANYTVKILEGLEYLHAKGVVHCDLKAANVLTTKSGDVKLTDFGVSRRLNVMDEKTSAVVGTPNWMAPEIITLSGIVPQSDLWSLGCTIIELHTGKPPYSELLPMAALFHIVEDNCPPLPENISEELEDFLHICFKKDPAERTTATELLEHKWILHNAHHDPRKRVMVDTNPNKPIIANPLNSNCTSSNTICSPKMQKCMSSTLYMRHNQYKSEGNINNDETSGMSEVDSTSPLPSRSSSNRNSQYITPTMIKQTSVDSLYKNTMILRSKTLPPKSQERIRRNLLKEYKHDIKIEEKEKKKIEKERKKLENLSLDEGWFSGPAELQMLNKDNFNNIQSNTSSSHIGHSKTLKDPRFQYSTLSHSQEKLYFLEKKSRRKSAFTQDKDKDKDCLIS